MPQQSSSKKRPFESCASDNSIPPSLERPKRATIRSYFQPVPPTSSSPPQTPKSLSLDSPQNEPSSPPSSPPRHNTPPLEIAGPNFRRKRSLKLRLHLPSLEMSQVTTRLRLQSKVLISSLEFSASYGGDQEGRAQQAKGRSKGKLTHAEFASIRSAANM